LGDKTSPAKTLTDSDIATHQRRGGPAGSAGATDADAHAHSDKDAHAAPDAAPKPAKDADAAQRTDSDS